MSAARLSVTDAVERCVTLLAKVDELANEAAMLEDRRYQAQLEVRNRDDAVVDQLVSELQQREDELLATLTEVEQQTTEAMALVENHVALLESKITGFGARAACERYRQEASRRAAAHPLTPAREPWDLVNQFVEVGTQIEVAALANVPGRGVDEHFTAAFAKAQQLRDLKRRVHAHLESYYNRWYDAEMANAEAHGRQRDRALGSAVVHVNQAHEAWLRQWRSEWQALGAAAPAERHANGWRARQLEGRLTLDRKAYQALGGAGDKAVLSAYDGATVLLNDSMVICQGSGDATASVRALEDQLWLSLREVADVEHRVYLCSAGATLDFAMPVMRFVKEQPQVTGGRVLTDSVTVATALKEHLAAMDDALQGKLVGYGSVEEFNRRNGAKPLPWRVLCVAHFPAGFDDRMTADLLRLVAQGPRAGIRVLVQADAEAAVVGRGTRTDDLVRQVRSLPQSFVVSGSGPWRSAVNGLVQLSCKALSPKQVGELTAAMAAATKRRSTASLDLAQMLPKERLQCCSAANRVSLPFGVNEDGRVQCLELGDAVAQGSSHCALVVGPTGSGKSVLLHDLITSALFCYGPQELQLCLLDFKEGTEFAPYANVRLPHLRYVALDSLQQFGESVLAQLVGLMRTRAESFKAASAGGAHIANIAEYRAAGHRMPRILVVMDEFQELFDCDRDRKCAYRAAAHFGELVSKGRAFGIHMVLATQTLHRIHEGNYAIAKASLEELHVRLGLKCSEREFANLMGQANATLCRQKTTDARGSAVFMEDYAHGRPVGVRVAYLKPERRTKLLEHLASRYEGRDFKPAYVFRGTQEERVPLAALAKASAEHQRVYVGKPVALGRNVGFDVAPGTPANLLVLAEDQTLLHRVGDTVLAQVAANSTMARQLFLFDAEALRAADEGAGALQRLAGRGVKVPRGLACSAANVFRVLPTLREAYDLFQRRKEALAAGRELAHANDPVYVVILGYEQIDPLVCLMEGRSVADYDVTPAQATPAPDADPLQAMLDDLAGDLANDAQGASAASVPPRQMLRTLLESGHLCNFHVVLTCGSPAALDRLLRSDLAPFNHRLVLPRSMGRTALVDTDIDLRHVPDGCVLYTDGQREAWLVKPFEVVEGGGR